MKRATETMPRVQPFLREMLFIVFIVAPLSFAGAILAAANN
jgi:hypothetical protein